MQNSLEQQLLCCARLAATPELFHKTFALPGDRPHYAPDRAIDITHIRLKIRLDFASRSVAATATIDARVLAHRLRTVVLDAFELEVEAAAICVTSGTEDGAAQPVAWHSDGKQLRLTLPDEYGRERA